MLHYHELLGLGIWCMYFQFNGSIQKVEQINFDIWAMMLVGLPKAKMENIHLIAASNQVSAIEMAEAIVGG